ncbi:plasmid replication protein RepA [Alicycliphilus sp. B1]|nr:plasmid replication protein RepA [Alicycliphilus sp. B1]
MTKKDLSGSARDVTNARPLRAAEADPAPEQNGKPLSLDYRASTPMPKWVHDVIDESFAIETEDAKKAGALGFMARALVNATLPYKDPKSPIFERRNGHYVLRMMGGNDNGLPYGVYPRLLMSWITTEAVRTGSPELELGESLSSFLRNVLGIQRGGGKRGANARVSEQMERLFSTLITATYTGDKGRSFNLRNVLIVDEASMDRETAQLLDEAAGDAAVAPADDARDEDDRDDEDDNRLWTPQSRETAGRWRSRVVLSSRFFAEIIERPVPIDLRAYRALRGSPVAMDLYTWMTYRMSYIERSTRPVPWEALMLQFGSNYAVDPKDPSRAVREFRNKSFKPALNVVREIYPEARFDVTERGLILHPSKPHVPQIKGQGALF